MGTSPTFFLTKKKQRISKGWDILVFVACHGGSLVKDSNRLTRLDNPSEHRAGESDKNPGVLKLRICWDKEL